MTQFDTFKNMTVEEFAEWLDENGQFDGSPWMKWFDEKFCSRCEAIECTYADYRKSDDDSSYKSPIKCSYCELEGECRFFPDMESTPDTEDIIKMWLKLELEENLNNHWERIDYQGLTHAKCSQCNKEQQIPDFWSFNDFIKYYAYCPCCGAKMNKEKV